MPHENKIPIVTMYVMAIFFAIHRLVMWINRSATTRPAVIKIIARITLPPRGIFSDRYIQWCVLFRFEFLYLLNTGQA